MRLTGSQSVMLLLLVAASPATAQDSPMFRGDPRHTGVHAGPALSRTLQLKWRFRTAGGLIASPAVVAGVVYIPSTDGKLYAVDAVTGRERWRFPTGARITSSPAVADGMVYVMSYDGTFYAVDATSGRQRWKFDTEGERRFTGTHLHGAIPSGEAMPDPYDMYLSSPAVVQGTVYFGSGDSHVYALDAGTGALRWKFKTGDVVHASPAIADGTVYIGSWDSYFYALDASTGAVRWRFKTGVDPDIHNQVGISSSAMIADGTVYFGCRDGHLYALNAQTGDSLWSFNTDQAWVTSSPVVHGEAVYFGAGSSARFFGADRRSGSQVLMLPFPRGFFSSPAVNGDMLYIGNMDGTLLGVDLTAGKVVSHFQTAAARRANTAYLAAARRAAADTSSVDRNLYDEMMARYHAALTGSILASPVIADGVLYLASTDGSLYALR
jgi:outer membrane protein assembly factor BamB